MCLKILLLKLLYFSGANELNLSVQGIEYSGETNHQINCIKLIS